MISLWMHVAALLAVVALAHLQMVHYRWTNSGADRVAQVKTAVKAKIAMNIRTIMPEVRRRNVMVRFDKRGMINKYSRECILEVIVCFSKPMKGKPKS